MSRFRDLTIWGSDSQPLHHWVGVDWEYVILDSGALKIRLPDDESVLVAPGHWVSVHAGPFREKDTEPVGCPVHGGGCG